MIVRLTEEEKKERKKLSNAKWHLKNQEKNKQKFKEYYLNNKESIIKQKAAFYKTEKGKVSQRKYANRRKEELSDSYIRNLVVKNSLHNGVKLETTDVTPEQMEIQRKMTSINRLIKLHKS